MDEDVSFFGGTNGSNPDDASGDYAKKTDLMGMYKYKGSKEGYALLPASGNAVGDVWNVESTDMNYAWDGMRWDPLGGTTSTEAITNSELEEILK